MCLSNVYMYMSWYMHIHVHLQVCLYTYICNMIWGYLGAQWVASMCNIDE